MSSHREVGGVVVAFLGFAFLVLSFKGTWHNVYEAALGHPAAAASPKTGTAAAASGMPGGHPPTSPLARPAGTR